MISIKRIYNNDEIWNQQIRGQLEIKSILTNMQKTTTELLRALIQNWK